MSLSKNFRWVLVSNLMIRNEKTVPAHVPAFSFEEFEEIVRTKFAAGDTSYIYQNEEKIMRIREIGEENDSHLTLLVSIGDKNAPEPSYENFNTDEIRDFEKDDDEGLSLACHIIIKKEAVNGRHLMMIEKMPGINLSSVSNYLRHLFNDDEHKKTYTEDGEDKDYRPIFEVTGYQADTLGHALETGKLQDVEFVSYQEIDDGYDEYGYVQESITTARLVVNRGIETDNATSFFDNVINKFRTGNFQKMFVKIKTNSGQVKTTEIDTSREDVLSQYFCHNEVINDFDEPLLSTHKTINEEVVNKILTKMGNHEEWPE